MNEPKGARKLALGIMSDLEAADSEIERCVVECKQAEDRYAEQVRKRTDLRLQLTNLINRCMESFGSDEGK